MLHRVLCPSGHGGVDALVPLLGGVLHEVAAEGAWQNDALACSVPCARRAACVVRSPPSQCGLRASSLRTREYAADELAHYARATTDIEFHYPFGWAELWGIAHRFSLLSSRALALSMLCISFLLVYCYFFSVPLCLFVHPRPPRKTFCARSLHYPQRRL